MERGGPGRSGRVGRSLEETEPAKEDVSQAVAEGSIVLSLDATQLNAGLKKAAQKAKSESKTIGQNFKEGSKDFLKDATGGDKGIFGGFGKAGLIGAGIAGVAMIGKEIWDVITPVKALEKELEKAADVQKLWRESIKESIEVEQEWISSLSSIAGTTEGMAAIEGRIAGIRTQVATLDADLKKTSKTKDDLDSKWNSLDNFGTWLTGGLETKQKAAAKEYDAAKSAREEADKAARDAQKQLSRLRDPLTNPAAVQAHRDFIRDLQYATKEIEGQSAETSKLLRLKEQFNLTSGQMREAMAAISAKELAQNAKDADDLIKTLTADVLELAGVAKKTAEEEKLDDLMKKGIDKDKAERIKGLIALKKLEAQQFTPLNALVRGTAQEITFQNKSKFEEARNAAVQKQLAELEKHGRILSDIREGIFKDKAPAEI